MPGRPMTTQQFVDKARKVHGEQYDYRKTEYNYNCEKVSIICPVHGEFSQKPVIHLSGSGCQKCGRRNSTLDQYLVKAKAVHGDRYDYSASKYTGANNKITFICKVHGVFEQHAHHHLSGHQCPRCAHTESFLSAAEWLEKAAKIHGNTYDYSKVAYVNARSPVTIVCRKHGEFQQMSDGHLQGAGCPRCCHRVSKPSIEWLEAMKVLDKTHIQHGGNGGEVRVQGTLWHADGFSAELNKVYEFHGDYFHGNPRKFRADEYNKRCKKTMGELYEGTCKRRKTIEDLGFDFEEIWQDEFQAAKTLLTLCEARA